MFLGKINLRPNKDITKTKQRLDKKISFVWSLLYLNQVIVLSFFIITLNTAEPMLKSAKAGRSCKAARLENGKGGD